MLCVALLSTVALTGIIFVGGSVSLVNKGLSVVQLRSLVPFLVTFSLPYALPTALLVASVFVFGRLSGANEITAMRVSGVNLNHIILPPLVLALAVSGGTFWLNHYLLPWSLKRVKVQTEHLIGEMLDKLGTVRKVYRIGPYVIYVGGTDPRTRRWQNVAVVEFAADEFPSRIMMAREAYCSVDEERDVANLLLFDGMVMQPQLGTGIDDQLSRGSFARLSHTIDLHTTARLSSERPKYFPLPELLGKLKSLAVDAEAARAQSANPDELAHPKTARRLAERERNEVYRKWNRIQLQVGTRKKAADKAHAAVGKTQESLLEAQAEQEAVAQRCEDLRSDLEDRKRYLEQLNEEFKSLSQRQIDPARIGALQKEIESAGAGLAELKQHLKEAEEPQRPAIQERIKERKRSLEQLKEDLNRIIARRSRVEQDLKRCLGEIQQEKAALAKLATRLAEAEGDCKRMTDSLNGIQRRMRGREKELGFAEKALASLQRDAAAVWKSFQKLSSRVNDVKRVESYQRARTEFHFRNAGAVTSLVFVLIGIPLGILSRRGSVLMAFVISFFAVLILYYPLMMVGKMLSLDAYMTPWLAQWLPDVVVAGVGTSLLAWGIRR